MNAGTSFERLSDCEVCGKHKAKYTCPRCELRTCCLECVKIHKKELDCNGQRDKVKFKTIKNFDNLDLLSDYRLLEETARAINRPVGLPAVSCYNPKNGCLPADLYRLKCTALRYGLQLHYLPPNFIRRKNNTSYLDFEAQNLFWRIEWIFVQAENHKFVDEKVLDTTVLSACVHKYIEPENGILHSMSFYQSAGHSGISMLLKADKTYPPRYHLLDPSSTIRENLCGKSVIEYPIIYVVLNDHTSMFEILTEEEEQILARKQMRRSRDKNKPSNYKKNNYLFSKTEEKDHNNKQTNCIDVNSFDQGKNGSDEPLQERMVHEGRASHNRYNNRWNSRRGTIPRRGQYHPHFTNN